MNKKKNKQIKLSSYLFKHKFLLSVYIISSILSTALGFLDVIFIANCLASVTAGMYDQAITNLIIFSALLLGGRFMFWISCIACNKYTAKTSQCLKNDILDRMFNYTTASYASLPTGKLVERLKENPRNFIGALDEIFVFALDIILQVAILVYICILNIWIGLIIIAGLFVVYGLNVWRNKLQSRNEKNRLDEAEGNTSIITEIANGEKDIKSLGLKKAVIKKAKDSVTRHENASYKYSATENTMFSISRGFAIVLSFVMLLVALFFLKDGALTAAVFMYIFTNRTTFMDFTYSFTYISAGVLKAKVVAGRIEEMFDEEKFPTEKFGSIELKNCRGEIEFKNVGFSYEPVLDEEAVKNQRHEKDDGLENQTSRLIEGLSFKIEPNTTVAFVGKSGSGKSTIMNLMAKMVDAESGSVCIDGVDIKELSQRSIRENIMLVTQFPYIFDASIRENILLASPDATEEEILKACKDANLLGYVNKLPEGLDTKIGENGVKMSGGEKQRLAIARALIKNAPIIMFDESTSSLDNVAQAEVTKSIQKLSGNHTVVIVAHRLSTIKNVDKIYFLEKGKIIDEGTFNELNSRNEKFQNIFRAENLEDELANLKGQNDTGEENNN